MKDEKDKVMSAIITMVIIEGINFRIIYASNPSGNVPQRLFPSEQTKQFAESHLLNRSRIPTVSLSL